MAGIDDYSSGLPADGSAPVSLASGTKPGLTTLDDYSVGARKTEPSADATLTPPTRTARQAGTPDLTNAPVLWKQSTEEIMEEATKGLSPGMAARMRASLARTQIEYDRKARGLQTKALRSNAIASLEEAERMQVETASRLGNSDAVAFEDVDSRRGAVAGALAGGDDPDAIHGGGVSDAVAPLGRYESMLKSYVASGIMTQGEADRRLTKLRESSALARANNMAIQSPQALVDLEKQEATNRDSTYLGMLDPVTRARVTESATTRLKALRKEELEDKDRQREELKRENAEMSERTEVMAAQKLSDPAQYGRLDMAWLDLASSLRLLSSEKYEHFKSQVQTQAVQGGVVDPLAVRRYSTEVYAPPKSYAATQANLMADRAKLPPELYRTMMNELEPKVRAERSGTLSPDLKEKTTAAMQLARTSLRATSPMEKLEPTQAVELSGIMRALDNNQFADKPRDPRDVLAELLPGAQARTKLGMETVAAGVSKSQRQALNLAPRATKEDQSIAKRTGELVQEYQSLPPTSPRRAQIKAQLQQLKELSAVESAMDTAADYEKRNPTSTIPTTSASTPISGSRRR